MKRAGLMVALSLAVTVSGCITPGNEVVHFQAKAQQTVMMREGQSVVTSETRNSIVTVRPATKGFGNRAIFIVGILNKSKRPLDFRLANVSAVVMEDGQAAQPLKVYSQNELIEEEQQSQMGRALLVSAIGGVNSGLAGNNFALQAQADYQNASLQAQANAVGQQNMAELEQLTIQDHTLLGGGEYAGKLYIAAPATEGVKYYRVSIMVGPDRHDIDVIQGGT